MSVIGIGYTQSTDPCAARGTGASAFGGAAAEALRELGDDGTAGGELRQAADAWNEIDLATCEAHAAGSLSSTLYELRSRCLDRALAVGTSAADTVASGDYPLQKARRALVESIDAAACLDDEGLLLGAPEAGYDAVAGDAIQRAIDRAHVFHTLGDDAAWLSMLEDATANIQDREAVLPDALWLSMQLGEALVRSARLEDAQEVLMPAMLEAKKHPKWSRTLGMLQVQLAKLALARKDFKQAELWITLAEPSLSGLRQQQHAFAAAAAHAAIAAAGRPVDALALADAAEEIATNAGPVSDGWAGARALHAELDAVRCDALSKLGRNGEAVAACVRAEERFAELGVQSGRTFAVLLNHHALALKRAGKRDAAVPLFERSATLDEEAGRVESAAEVRVNLANLLDASGMHEQALREYDRAEHVLGDTRGKAWVSVHFNRSIARAGVGDWAGASGDARNALSANAELNPDDPAALYYQEVALGIAEAKLSRVEQAREVLELAIRHERDFHDPYSKAELRLALGGLVDSTRAKALFEEAVFFATESRDETLLGAARNALKSANTTGAR